MQDRRCSRTYGLCYFINFIPVLYHILLKTTHPCKLFTLFRHFSSFCFLMESHIFCCAQSLFLLKFLLPLLSFSYKFPSPEYITKSMDKLISFYTYLAPSTIYIELNIGNMDTVLDKFMGIEG